MGKLEASSMADRPGSSRVLFITRLSGVLSMFVFAMALSMS